MWEGTVQDQPYTLLFAVNEALMVLSWHENLTKDEIPPRHLWWSGELLDKWFQAVEKKRTNKGGSTRSTYDEADDAPMMGNELFDKTELVPK